MDINRTTHMQIDHTQVRRALLPIFALILFGLFLGFKFNHPVNDVIALTDTAFYLLQVCVSIIVTALFTLLSYKLLSFNAELRTRTITIMPLAGIFFAVMVGGPLAYLNSLNVNVETIVTGKVIDAYATKSLKGNTRYKIFIVSDVDSLLKTGDIDGLTYKQFEKWGKLNGKHVEILVGRGMIGKLVIMDIVDAS